MKEYYWFSFSYQEENKGVCLTEANCPHEALAKLIKLEIAPQFDNIKCFGIPEAEIPLDTLFTAEEMIKAGYIATSD
jgi:hypothetical protein